MRHEQRCRDVYVEPKNRAVIRTEDVYQTETEDGVAGYSDKAAFGCRQLQEQRAPEGFNAQSMVRQVQARGRWR